MSYIINSCTNAKQLSLPSNYNTDIILSYRYEIHINGINIDQTNNNLRVNGYDVDISTSNGINVTLINNNLQINGHNIDLSNNCNTHMEPSTNMINYKPYIIDNHCLDISEPNIHHIQISDPEIQIINISGPNVHHIDIEGLNIDRIDISGPNVNHINISGSKISQVNISGPNDHHIYNPGYFN